MARRSWRKCDWVEKILRFWEGLDSLLQVWGLPGVWELETEVREADQGGEELEPTHQPGRLLK